MRTTGLPLMVEGMVQTPSLGTSVMPTISTPPSIVLNTKGDNGADVVVVAVVVVVVVDIVTILVEDVVAVVFCEGFAVVVARALLVVGVVDFAVVVVVVAAVSAEDVVVVVFCESFVVVAVSTLLVVVLDEVVGADECSSVPEVAFCTAPLWMVVVVVGLVSGVFFSEKRSGFIAIKSRAVAMTVITGRSTAHFGRRR